MPPQAVSLALFLIEEAIKLSPSIYAELQQLCALKSNPTPDDWAELRAKATVHSYRDFVPMTRLPLVTSQADKAP